MPENAASLPGMHHLFTVGHSTHPLDEFVTMLHAHGVAVLGGIAATCPPQDTE